MGRPIIIKVSRWYYSAALAMAIGISVLGLVSGIPRNALFADPVLIYASTVWCGVFGAIAIIRSQRPESEIGAYAFIIFAITSRLASVNGLHGINSAEAADALIVASSGWLLANNTNDRRCVILGYFVMLLAPSFTTLPVTFDYLVASTCFCLSIRKATDKIIIIALAVGLVVSLVDAAIWLSQYPFYATMLAAVAAMATRRHPWH